MRILFALSGLISQCVYPSKKAFDPGAIAASLSKRHKNGSSSELNVLPASPSPRLSPYVPYSHPPAPPFAALNRPLLPSGISHESLPDNSRHGVSSRPDPLDRSVPTFMSGASSDPSNGVGGAHGGKDVDRAASMENVMRMPQLSKLDPHLQPIDIPQVQQVFTDPNELQHVRNPLRSCQPISLLITSFQHSESFGSLVVTLHPLANVYTPSSRRQALS